MADERVVVVPYDPAWPGWFEAERTLLEHVLGPWLKGGIHHIGSTAIPGIAAKPIIDMMAGVRDLDEARAAFEPLLQHSYHHTPHRPGIAHHFSKPSPERATHGLHLTEPGTDLWRERLAFRDALRGDPRWQRNTRCSSCGSLSNTVMTLPRTRTASVPSLLVCSRSPGFS